MFARHNLTFHPKGNEYRKIRVFRGEDFEEVITLWERCDLPSMERS